MKDASSFGDEFDDTLNEVLPDDIDDVSPADRESIYESYSFGHSYSREAAVDQARAEMDRVAAELGISDQVVDMAEQIFTQFGSATTLEGRVIELIADACFYCACKLNEVPVDPTTVSDTGGNLLTRKRLLRRVKNISSELGLDPTSFFNAAHYVPHYCDELNLSADIEDRATEILEICEEAGLASGKSPSGWAGAAIYNAVLEYGAKTNQSAISEVANVTEVTIRNRYKEQRAHLRERTQTPHDCPSAIGSIATILDLGPGLAQGAVDLVSIAEEQADESLEDGPWTIQDLALAVLKLASERSDSTLGYSRLKHLTESDSDTIRACERMLKQRVKRSSAGTAISSHQTALPSPQSFESPDQFQDARRRVVAEIASTENRHGTNFGKPYPNQLEISRKTIEQTFGHVRIAEEFVTTDTPNLE